MPALNFKVIRNFNRPIRLLSTERRTFYEMNAIGQEFCFPPSPLAQSYRIASYVRTEPLNYR
jgi:hypothetical protein